MILQGGYAFENILAHGKRASQRFLQRAGAFIRACARRNLKRRKHVSSKEGEPPYVHSGIYKASVLFATDPMAQTVYVGPQALSGRKTNASGKGVPEILEYGGYPARGIKGNWWTKQAPEITDFTGLVRYVFHMGKGPFVWGKTVAETQKKMDEEIAKRKNKDVEKAKGGKRMQYRNFQRYAPRKGKKVYIQNIRVKTPKQARMVAQNVLELFGYPSSKRYIEARPLMQYTMSQPNVQRELAKIQQEEFSNYTK